MLLQKLHSNRGFTLVEMVATILCVSIILFGASAALLSAFRTQYVTNDSTRMQQTERIVHRGLQQLSGLVRTYQRSSDGSVWTLCGENGAVLVSYSDGTLRVGGNEVWTGITSTMDDPASGKLVTVVFTQNEHSYQNVVNCRMLHGETPPGGGGGEIQGGPELPSSEQTARDAYLATLAGQYGSTGKIAGSDTYYSEWYIGGSYLMNPAWNEDTPWCACFLSWALAQQPEDSLSETPRFATVDDGADWFRARDAWLTPEETPLPGDLVFFDWDADGSADHVGAVLTYGADGLVTVEGNSNGRVESRSYPTDSPFLLGYGVLPWN